MIEGYLLVVDKPSGRFCLTPQSSWDSPNELLPIFGYAGTALDDGYSFRDYPRGNLTLAKVTDISKTDLGDLFLRFLAAARKIPGKMPKATAFPIRCNCGKPYSLLQELVRGAEYPFRMVCLDEQCTYEALKVRRKHRVELHHWFPFKDLASGDSSPMNSTKDEKDEKDMSDIETKPIPSIGDRLKKAAEQVDVRSIRMVALDEGKQALLDGLKGHLDPLYMDPLETFLNAPGGEAALLAAIGAGAPYATDNEFVCKVGDEFLAEGMAKGAHQGLKLLAMVLKPVYAAIEKKMPASVMAKVVDKVSTPKRRVAAASASPNSELEAEEEEESPHKGAKLSAVVG